MSISTTGPLPSPPLISACLDGIVHALSDRPDLSEQQRMASARAAMTLILSFLPGDVIQMMLAGQAVLFNALAADGSRDVLRGMADTLKLRAQASVTNMGKLTAKHLDTLIRLQGQPVRTQTPCSEAPAARTVSAGPNESAPDIGTTEIQAPEDRAEMPNPSAAAGQSASPDETREKTKRILVPNPRDIGPSFARTVILQAEQCTGPERRGNGTGPHVPLGSLPLHSADRRAAIPATAD